MINFHEILDVEYGVSPAECFMGWEDSFKQREEEQGNLLSLWIALEELADDERYHAEWEEEEECALFSEGYYEEFAHEESWG